MRTPLLFLAMPVAATLAGGLFAIRFERIRPVLVAVGAGLLLGAAFLDLLPEAIALGGAAGLTAGDVLGWTLLFFLGFSGLESGLGYLAGSKMRGGTDRGGARQRLGWVGGGLLIFHSLRDGMAIGAAFAASHTAGYAVATGIAAHDFADGMNTVILTTAGEKPRAADYVFLGADAIAPFAGGLLTTYWLLSSRSAAVLLALSEGFFLQMATSDFLPQVKTGAGTDEPVRRKWRFAAVMAGAAMMWMTNLLLGGR